MNDQYTQELNERVVTINRVTKVVKSIGKIKGVFC